MTRARRRWATRIASIGIASGAVVLIGPMPAAVDAAPATARVQFRLHDPRIDEASGIAVGLRSPGVVYAQNDSGDTNRFFALDARTGATVATVTVRGARNVDWEDIAVAPDAAGMSSVWLADTGDNRADRSEIRVYRVDEPALRPGQRGRAVTTEPADVWRLRYPDGPVDAESFTVTPRGVGYLITKSIAGRSQVYRLPPAPEARHVHTLAPVGAIRFTPTGTANPFSVLGNLTATGASMSTDGSLLVIRTYSDAWLWEVHDDDVAAALRRSAVRVALPDQRQGEGIAFDGGGLLIDSEGKGTRVFSVPMPASLRASASADRSSSASAEPGADPGTGRASGSPVAASATALPVVEADDDGGGVDVGGAVVFGAALAVIVGGCLAYRVWVRHGRRNR